MSLHEDGVLDTEIGYYNKIKNELVKRAKGEYALIRGEGLIGTFKDEFDALHTGYRLFGNTPFLVREILEKERIIHLAPIRVMGTINNGKATKDN